MLMMVCHQPYGRAHHIGLFLTMRIKVIQRVGDRDKESWSIKDYAFTIPANPMSDRVQMILYVYDD